jgi:two-component system sensor histidine kinase KdpD
VDPVLFEQVVINLIDNAVKHGAPPIEIAARQLADRMELVVCDHGAGIAPADATRLFDKFVRSSTASGAGLGLAVVRAIIEAHGGTVDVDAASQGARFRVALPADQARMRDLAEAS